VTLNLNDNILRRKFYKYKMTSVNSDLGNYVQSVQSFVFLQYESITWDHW